MLNCKILCKTALYNSCHQYVGTVLNIYSDFKFVVLKFEVSLLFPTVQITGIFISSHVVRMCLFGILFFVFELIYNRTIKVCLYYLVKNTFMLFLLKTDLIIPLVTDIIRTVSIPVRT